MSRANSANFLGLRITEVENTLKDISIRRSGGEFSHATSAHTQPHFCQNRPPSGAARGTGAVILLGQ